MDKLERFANALPAYHRARYAADALTGPDAGVQRAEAIQAHADFVAGSFDAADFAAIDRRDRSLAACRLRAAYRLWLRAQPESDRALMALAARIEEIIYAHRVRVDGRDLDAPELLGLIDKTADEAERARLWHAYFRPDPALAADFARLLALRHAVAQRLGFRDALVLGLAQEDLSAAQVATAFAAMDAATRSVVGSVPARKAKAGLAVWAPWNRGGGGSKRALPAIEPDLLLERCLDFLGRIGCPLPAHVTIERTSMPIGGVVHLVEIPRDIRVVVSPISDLRGAERLMHELGHALHFSAIETADPLLQDETSGALVEAYAQFFAAFTRSPTFLAEVFGAAPGDAARAAASLERSELMGRRVMLALARAEHAMLANGPDYAAAYARAYCETMGYDRIGADDWHWDIMAVVKPVYNQNYVFADLIADALAARLAPPPQRRLSADAARLLKTRFFAPGATEDWIEKVEAQLGPMQSWAACANR